MKKAVLFSGLVFVSFVLSGCFSSNPEDIKAFLKPTEVEVDPARYILQPPDEVEIHCSKVPELHLQRQQIRPDGMVSFEGIGEIMAAGRTPQQLANVIKEKVIMLYTLAGENPIDVRVVAYESRVYYVLGHVYFPGPKIATGRDTVFRALARSRPTELAWVERVQVIRPSRVPGKKPKIFEVDYDRMIAHGNLKKDVLLQEGDVVYVPPTVLAGIALKIEEFVRPIGRAFSTVNIVEGQPGRR